MHGEIGDPGGQGTPRRPRPPHDDADDDQRRSLLNVAALIFVILLVVGGVWLAKVMQRHARLEDCLMSGRTNCAPLDTSH